LPDISLDRSFGARISLSRHGGLLAKLSAICRDRADNFGTCSCNWSFPFEDKVLVRKAGSSAYLGKRAGARGRNAVSSMRSVVHRLGRIPHHLWCEGSRESIEDVLRPDRTLITSCKCLSRLSSVVSSRVFARYFGVILGSNGWAMALELRGVRSFRQAYTHASQPRSSMERFAAEPIRATRRNQDIFVPFSSSSSLATGE
jgi:hypothetical protein